MRSWILGAALMGTGLLAACGGGNAPLTAVTVFPTTATVLLGHTQQFTATVSGATNTSVTWAVSPPNGTPVPGGNATLGTISSTGLYTAPTTLPNPRTVTVIATSQANTKITGTATVTVDSGIRVQVTPLAATLGTGETFTFTAVVTGTPNSAVTWAVNNIAGGNSTVGTISATGVYTAPSAPQTVTISATSAADTTQVATASAGVSTAVDPTLTAIDPSAVSQGSAFLDLFLSGSGFFSTSKVLVNGAAVTTSFLGATALHAQVPPSSLANAGSLPVTVQRQNGDIAPPLNLTVSPVRPAIISALPESAPQGGAPATVCLTGGYYSPSTTAEFNGQARPASFVNSRRLDVVLSGSDQSTAGLFPLVVRNPGVAAVAAVNLAVEPPASAIPSAPIATIVVGSQPSALAINSETGVAVVANRGDNTVTLIDLNTNSAIATLAVGRQPTGVAVDNLKNLALVVNNGDNTLSVVDLAARSVTATVNLPSGTTAFSIGVNPLTHRALVANQSTNAATIIDLATAPPSVLTTVGGSLTPVSTGASPQVAVDPDLNWAIVTPGGSGTITFVDLGLPAGPGDGGRPPKPLATLSISTSIVGIAINTQTKQALLIDPTGPFQNVFNVLDDTVNSLTLETGNLAAAVNPLTNLGVVVNEFGNQASVVNLRTRQRVAAVGVGTSPQAVAIDAANNVALVANQGSNNVSVLSLGPIRSLHVVQSSPITTLASSSPLPLTLIGNGFVGGSLVRLDQTPLPTANVTVVSSRQIVATIPASLLSGPRRYAVDVQNPSGTISNETSLTVMQAVAVGSSPEAVAIDSERGLAVVTNTADNNVSIVSLSTGTASAPIAVGTSPQGVAVLPRLGRAVVTNSGSNTASILDLVGSRVVATVNVGSAPLGVAIEPNTGVAVVANSGSDSITLFAVDSGTPLATIPVDPRPMAVAVDPVRNLAAVTTTSGAQQPNSVDIIDLGGRSLVGRRQVFTDPTDVTFDPVAGNFLVANSLLNNIVLLNPASMEPTGIRVGINPTSLAYNFNSSTLVTVNSASNTLSVMDLLAQSVRAVVNLAGSAQFSIAIDPRTNLAVLVDQNNNRVLLVPLPR